MVAWVFSLKADADKPILQRGLQGEITVPADTANARAVKIDATFTDAGQAPASPLTTQAGVTLRNRRLEAELNDGAQGTQALGGATASCGKFIGDTSDGQHLRFNKIKLDTTSKITCRVASAGQGGWIEIHAAKPDGPLLAKLQVPVTGGWEIWQEITVPLTKPDPVLGDLYVVFINPGKGGLMNLDWIQFEQ